jgi:hypothetical protein
MRRWEIRDARLLPRLLPTLTQLQFGRGLAVEDKLSRHAYTLPCLMGGGRYDAVDTIDIHAPPCWVATPCQHADSAGSPEARDTPPSPAKDLETRLVRPGGWSESTGTTTVCFALLCFAFIAFPSETHTYSTTDKLVSGHCSIGAASATSHDSKSEARQPESVRMQGSIAAEKAEFVWVPFEMPATAVLTGSNFQL